MSNTSSAEDPLGQQLAQVTSEIRRQGRASVAAQAAAETCLEAVQDLASRLGNKVEPPRSTEEGTRWLKTLLPVFDALDRAMAQTERASRRARGAGWKLWSARHETADELAAVYEGLRVLQEQLASALSELEVNVDREVGCAVDPKRHRVVEVDALTTTGPRVVEVLRPGYSLGERQLREAEVRATRTSHSDRKGTES